MVQKEKQSNYELMRIVSMFMIVLWHVIVHNVSTDELDPVLSIVINAILFFLVVHVNSYVLLTGYFSLEKKTTWKKAWSLLKMAWMYRVVIALVLTFTSLVAMSRVQLFQELMPLDVADYWFINCYLLLLMLIPFLNILIQNINEVQHRNLLLISFALFCIIPYITNQATVNNNGYSIIQFVFLYFLGAYLKKYPLAKNYYFVRCSKKKLQFLFIGVFFSCIVINFLLSYYAKGLVTVQSSFMELIRTTISHGSLAYSNPLIVIQSVAYFCFFGTLHIKSKKINKISSLCFGIYLFHDNNYVRQVIYKPFQLVKHAKSLSFIPYWFMVASAIFILGLLIEYLRRCICDLISKVILKVKLKKSNS